MHTQQINKSIILKKIGKKVASYCFSIIKKKLKSLKRVSSNLIVLKTVTWDLTVVLKLAVLFVIIMMIESSQKSTEVL